MGMFETLSADALGRLDCWTVEALAGLTEFSNFDGEHHFVQHMDVPVSYFSVVFCRCCVGAMLVVVVVLVSLLSV